MVLKPDVLSAWEALIPDGKGNGFNSQTWGEMTMKFLRPISELSDQNFMKITEETECYLKASAKGKDTISTSDEEEAADFFDFR